MIIYDNSPEDNSKPVLRVSVLDQLIADHGSTTNDVRVNIYTIDSLNEGEMMSAGKDGWAKFYIRSISDESIVVERPGYVDEEIKIDYGSFYQTMFTSFPDSNMYVDHCGRLTFFYYRGDMVDNLLSLVDRIRETHATKGNSARIEWDSDMTLAGAMAEELYRSEQTDDKDHSLSYSGFVFMHFLKSCNNWWTFKLRTLDKSYCSFIYFLNEYTRIDYLNPDDKLGWYVMMSLMKKNHPDSFITKKEVFVELLKEAVLNGNVYALEAHKLFYGLHKVKTSSKDAKKQLRLLAIEGEMKINYDGYTEWRNVKLLREAYELLTSMPDSFDGYYSSRREKAALLNRFQSQTLVSDAPRLCLDICKTICELSDEGDENYPKYQKNLQKRTDYLDPNISPEEFCRRYNVEMRYDDVELTEEWERVTCDVQEQAYQEVAYLKGDTPNNICSMSLLKAAAILRQHGIEWRDIVKMNPEYGLNYFDVAVDDAHLRTDESTLFEVYNCAGKFEEIECGNKCCKKQEEIMTHIIELLKQWRSENKYVDKALVDEAIEVANTVIQKLKEESEDNADEDNEGAYDILLEMIVLLERADMEARAMLSADTYESDNPLCCETLKQVAHITRLHRASGSNRNAETTAAEQTVLDNLKTLIEEHGRGDLVVLRARLSATNNWGNWVLQRPTLFAIMVQEGIDRYGCLAPDRVADWKILEHLSQVNDPTDFIEDKDVYYDILSTAVEEGNSTVSDIASVLRDNFWEPEEVNDEDLGLIDI